MCGRYSITTPAEAMRLYFDADAPAGFRPRFNIAPTQSAPVVRAGKTGRHMDMLRWGLVPSWAKSLDIGNRMINARAETVTEKPAFRAAFRQRRCLVPACGFYEWKATGKRKQPWRICLDGAPDKPEPFAFAGLWERWSGPEGDVESYTIITTEAAPEISQIHHRMPVMLAREDYDLWLMAEDPALALPLLRPWHQGNGAPALTAYPVSTSVNKPANDDAALLRPVEIDDGPAIGETGSLF